MGARKLIKVQIMGFFKCAKNKGTKMKVAKSKRAQILILVWYEKSRPSHTPILRKVDLLKFMKLKEPKHK